MGAAGKAGCNFRAGRTGEEDGGGRTRQLWDWQYRFGCKSTEKGNAFQRHVGRKRTTEPEQHFAGKKTLKGWADRQQES